MRIPDLKWAVYGPSTSFGHEMVKFGPNFCYCAVDQEKVVFKRAVSGPSALGARNGKNYSNFCYCAADQERVRSSPSALLGPKMVKFCPTFCQILKGNGPFLAHLPIWGPKWSNFARISAYSAADQEKVVFKKGNGPFLARLPFSGQALEKKQLEGHRLAPRFGVPHSDGLLASGLTAQPTAACGTGSSGGL